MKHQRRENEDLTYTDPVCGMEVSYKTAPEVLTYNKKTYCFCADVCRQAFEDNPEKYIHKFKKTG